MEKTGQKFNALPGVTLYKDLPKRRMLSNALFLSQLSYCLLVWIFQSDAKINKINRLQERCLRIIYSDKKSTFIELLEKNNYVSIHKRNLRLLVIEISKFKRGLGPTLC